MWFLYAFLSALFSALRKGNEKVLAQNLSPLTLGVLLQLFSLPVQLLFLVLSGEVIDIGGMGVSFWLPTLAMSVVVYPAFFYFYARALRLGELSQVLPIQALTPLFSLILGFAFIGQSVTAVAALGMILSMLGVYAVNYQRGGMRQTLLHLWSGPSRDMIIAVACSAAAGALDTVAIEASGPQLYGVVTRCIILAVFLPVIAIRERTLIYKARHSLSALTSSGLFAGLSYSLYVASLKDGLLAYVSSLKSLSILIGVAIGIIYFKERLTIRKVIAVLFVSIGSICIAIGG